MKWIKTAGATPSLRKEVRDFDRAIQGASMTSTKPLVVNRAQLLDDAERLEEGARTTRKLLSRKLRCPKDSADEVARAERAAQVLRAVAEGVQSVDHCGSDGKLSGYTGCDGDVVPVLIIPATISPAEGEGT